jgi:hypothetical protein
MPCWPSAGQVLGWGVAGAGWATAIAEAVGSLLAARIMLRHVAWPRWRERWRGLAASPGGNCLLPIWTSCCAPCC